MRMIGDYLRPLRGQWHYYNLDDLPDGVVPDFGDKVFIRTKEDTLLPIGEVTSFPEEIEYIKGYPHFKLSLLPSTELDSQFHYLYPGWIMEKRWGRTVIRRMYNGSKILSQRDAGETVSAERQSRVKELIKKIFTRV